MSENKIELTISNIEFHSEICEPSSIHRQVSAEGQPSTIESNNSSSGSNLVNLEIQPNLSENNISENNDEKKEASQLVLSIVSQIKNTFEHYTLNQQNIINYVVKIMTIVDTEKIKGPEKKTIVIDVLNHLIMISELDSEEKLILKGMVRLIIPSIIENISLASKGMLEINKKISKKNICSCF
jgi:hypothetical protein